MNTWIGMGHLGRDVELRYTTDSLAVSRFSLAISRGKDKNGNDKGTDWINCVAFGKTAENIERFFGKGSQIAITGHIQTGSYEKDGVKHYTTDVIVDRFDFCGKAKEQPADETGFTELNEDIPF